MQLDLSTMIIATCSYIIVIFNTYNASNILSFSYNMPFLIILQLFFCFYVQAEKIWW